ncbi:MAG: YncE family protein [Bacteroidota bacterium]
MKKLFKIALLVLLIAGCSEEPVETVFFDLDTQNGVFIASEGNFMYGNAALSFYNPPKKTVTNQLFYARNNAPLGDVVQSLALFGDSLFIVVNNSGKIYVADSETVEYLGAVSGMTSPRHIHFVSEEKAYISDLYANSITIFNPATLEVASEIKLGDHNSEQMVQIGKYVFASSWADDEYVLIIDTEKDELMGKIKVPFQPKDLEADKNGKIWVLSEGVYENTGEKELLPALTRIDPETFTIEQIYRFPAASQPASLEINASKDTLFYILNGIYKMAVDERYLPDSVFIPAGNKLFYNLAVDPDNNEIYVADAIDYSQDAIIYRYSQSNDVIDSFKVGINPSYFLFR